MRKFFHWCSRVHACLKYLSVVRSYISVMAVIGVARQRLYMGDELAALAMLEGGGNADLDAELVRLVGLALADAFHFGGMQAVDLGAALPAFLLAHPPAKAEQGSEAALEPMVAVGARQREIKL